ncbi:hypothetical protein LWC34_38340 [Kibdelosporangium philippinense]|uniref:PknH-like extracellular domain-containing protein n=1 Tax=Kibdelosporangium philippinense TaxID=211113 RepID=A0ABS8ZLG0_9PSEU|nr:hypothetical protein [Kibdelosporangium philippinense]MCE7008633.1 hypothetical protein [Kibdelosporangium philippinense]
MSVDAKALIHKGRRHTMIARSSVIGGVSLAVVGVVFGATLTRPEPAEIPVATSSPPVPCRVGSPECPPVHVFTEDLRVRTLLDALRAGRYPPAGMTAQDQWTVYRFDGPTAYQGGVAVGDKDGFGTLSLYINNVGGNGTCATLDRIVDERLGGGQAIKDLWFVDCRDVTLDDGAAAAISRYEGRDTGYQKIAVDAAKPDGTRVRFTIDNFGPAVIKPGSTPTRPTPPLTGDDLLKLVKQLGVK